MATPSEMQNSCFPALSSKDEDMKGPTTTSNWVIKGKLIAGAYPGSRTPAKHTATLESVMAAGVSTFVCLMEEDERENKQFVPYEDIAREHAKTMGRELQFITFPIPDQSVADEEKLLELIPKLVEIVKEGSQCVYVHCLGGHGRTGIIIAILLAMLYKIDAEKALELTEAFHSQRVECRNHSPQTPPQFEQVRDVIKKTAEVCVVRCWSQ